MIQISGKPLQQNDIGLTSNTQNMIVKLMLESPLVYEYQTLEDLSFELKLRENITLSAQMMYRSGAQFAVFENSRCNPRYWLLTNVGGFQLKQDVKPSEAILDIFRNGSHYAFECAGAMLIIYYHAALNLIGEFSFNQLFSNIYIYSWNSDPDLGLGSSYLDVFLPGDIVYFNNPDFDPRGPNWRGENAVVLGNGLYFGHGPGIVRAEQIIKGLNGLRKPRAKQSAYLMNIVVRPSFKNLKKLALLPDYSVRKYQPVIIHHSEGSISFDRYWSFVIGY